MNIIERIRFASRILPALFDKLMSDIKLEKKKKLSARRPGHGDPDG